MVIHPPFHEQLRCERELRGWSQADLAEKVGCDAKTVGRWETGIGFPHPYHRQKLCEIFGKNAEELGMARKNGSQPVALEEGDVDDPLSPLIHEEDWGEAPYVVNLYGRDEECVRLASLLADHHSQVVAVMGMGGVGKTAVAAKIAMQVRQNFEYVFWRSLQNAPPLEILLKQCISFVSHQQQLDLPQETNDQITLLTHYLREQRCLLVLDNFESIMQAGQRAGHYREGYAAYGRLLQRVGEAQHQSCLLLTGREKPREVALLEGKSSPVRSLHLSGLPLDAGQHLLHDKGLVGSDADQQALVERYSGNPLALQVVAELIQEVFAGDIAGFLQKEVVAFGDIHDLLDQQFHRLSSLEQEIMYWLAIEREALSLDGLRENLVSPVALGAQLEALDSLRRRFLLETRGPSAFTLQPVIMEYVTMNLIERTVSEFDTEAQEIWTRFAFIKAQAKDYLRESQLRLLLDPIAQRLLDVVGKEGIEQRARNMLLGQRVVYALQPGYLAGNVLNLLSHLHCDLRGIDCSHLIVRQAYLQGVSLPHANFAHARFVDSIFSRTFGNILSVAYNWKTQWLAAGTASGEILLYDAPAGTLHLTCHGHTDGVWSLAFSPDGSLLASSSDDHTVRLWNTRTGECIWTLQEHTNRVRAVTFSPNGNILVSGSDDQSIRLWNIHTGECLATLVGHTDRVWAVAFAPGGTLLASGSTDNTVRVWDVEQRICLATLRGHTGSIRSVAFLGSEHHLASGSDDQTIRFWNVDTGKCSRTLIGHSSRVWSVAFQPEKNVLASSSEDQSIRLWDIATGRCVMILRGHYQGVRSIALPPDGSMLISGGDDQTIRIWDTASGHCLRTMQGYTNRVWCVVFQPNESVLASASEDGALCLWDAQTGQRLKLMQDRSHGPLAIAFNPHDATLVSAGQDQMIHLWDIRTGHCRQTLRGHVNWVRAVTFCPDGSLLASGGEDQTIRLWDVRTGTCVRLLRGHTSWVRSLAFSPDSTLLASGADDQTIRLWNVADGLHLRTLENHTGRVRSVAFSPDGRLLASGSEDQTVRIWDIEGGRCLNLLSHPAGWVRSVAFSPDGSLLASGGEDQMVRLWDVKSGRCLNVFEGHRNRVRGVAFSPDGTILASSSDDGTVKLWNLRTYDCLKTLISERPYEQMNIAHVQGLTEAEKTNLRALGAIEV